MIKVGDIVFIYNSKDSIYQLVDTDPRFINYGVVKKVLKDEYHIEDKNGEVIIYTKYSSELKIVNFNEYIKRCNDISYHLKCNAEMAQAIKDGFDKE